LAYNSRTGRPCRLRYVLYCLKGEEWRLEAMFLVKKTLLKMRADEGIDRITGALLGYSDEEIDQYVVSRTSPYRAL
jgi:hypothetical protein